VNGIESMVKAFGWGILRPRNIPPNPVGGAMIAFLTAIVIRCRRAARLQSGSSGRISQRVRKGGNPMEWVQPDFEEISLACEINSYAAATL